MCDEAVKPNSENHALHNSKPKLWRRINGTREFKAFKKCVFRSNVIEMFFGEFFSQQFNRSFLYSASKRRIFRISKLVAAIKRKSGKPFKIT